MLYITLKCDRCYKADAEEKKKKKNVKDPLHQYCHPEL